MKVQSKLVGNTPTQAIDWDKPQLVFYKDAESMFVVLTTGFRHDEKDFEGIVVFSQGECHTVGRYGISWMKPRFQLLSPNQQVILQNTDEPNPTPQ